MLEGPQTIAAIILEPVTGTNGILIPPDGYMQGVRALCDKHGIVMIADEVMSGFGRTGEWFAINHWKVVPDIMTMAKGITSSYVPLGAVGIRRKIADFFNDKMFPGGLTYSSHALACATALATIAVYEEDGLIERAKRTGKLMAQLMADLATRHPSVGAVRSIGLFRRDRADSESRDEAADGALQRRGAGDGRARASSSGRRDSLRSSGGITSSPTRR